MAILMVTYDLKTPGRDYTPVHTYLKKYRYCKGLESVWLLDTTVSTATVRDELKSLVDSNDVIFVARLQRDWASLRYSCADWLKESTRAW